MSPMRRGGFFTAFKAANCETSFEEVALIPRYPATTVQSAIFKFFF